MGSEKAAYSTSSLTGSLFHRRQFRPSPMRLRATGSFRPNDFVGAREGKWHRALKRASICSLKLRLSSTTYFSYSEQSAEAVWKVCNACAIFRRSLPLTLTVAVNFTLARFF
jgi:hypothetical protein